MIEVLRKEDGEFDRSTCMGCVVSNRRVETAMHDLYIDSDFTNCHSS